MEVFSLLERSILVTKLCMMNCQLIKANIYQHVLLTKTVVIHTTNIIWTQRGDPHTLKLVRTEAKLIRWNCAECPKRNRICVLAI